MGEPLARMDIAGEGPLAVAAQRLERAIQALEVAVAATPSAGSAAADSVTQVVELNTARRRARELESAASQASQTLGRAMAEVRQALDENQAEAGDPQTSLFEQGLLDSPLETGPGLPDEDAMEADGPPSEKEPAA